MSDQDLLNESEPDTVAARLGREERNEYSVEVRGGDPASGVANSYVRITRLRPRINRAANHDPLVRRKWIDSLDRVAKKVDECALEQRFISGQRGKFTFDSKFDRVLKQPRSNIFCAILDDLAKVHFYQAQILRAREVEKVGHKLAQQSDFIQSGLERRSMIGAGPRCRPLGLQKLNVAVNR